MISLKKAGIIAGLTTLILGACMAALYFALRESQPLFYVQYELSPNLEVTKWMSKGERTIKLRTPIPEKYLLKRGKYEVELEIEIRSNTLLTYITIDEGDFIIIGDYIMRFGESYIFDAEKKYKKTGLKTSAMEFKVVDREGNIVGEEAIPYSISVGGVVYSYDLF